MYTNMIFYAFNVMAPIMNTFALDCAQCSQKIMMKTEKIVLAIENMAEEKSVLLPIYLLLSEVATKFGAKYNFIDRFCWAKPELMFHSNKQPINAPMALNSTPKIVSNVFVSRQCVVRNFSFFSYFRSENSISIDLLMGHVTVAMPFIQ